MVGNVVDYRVKLGVDVGAGDGACRFGIKIWNGCSEVDKYVSSRIYKETISGQSK